MKYLITVILFLSVQNLSAQVANDNDSIDINKWYKNLPEVIVKAEKPIVKLVQGKMVYNMHNLLEKLPADNAYEALTRIPGVSDATGNISLLGNAVTLIINGQATTLTQEQLAERLKAMPAAQLAKAEVMLSAPARYHVRGMAINIVTKDYAGTNRLSGQMVGGLQQNKYSTGFGNLYLSMQRGKFGLDAQYQYVNSNSYVESSHIANHPLGNKRVNYYDETWQKSFGITHDYRLGMNYAFSKNHHLDIAYTGNWKMASSNSQTTGLSVSRVHLDSHEYLHNVDVNYSLPFGLTLSGSYTHYRTPQQQWLDGTMQADENTTETERNLTSGSEQTINKWMFTADQNHSLAHGWGLSYGVKGQFASNKSYQNTLNKTGNILPNATSSVDINERIWNMYAGFSKQVNKAISLEASVAAEQYHSPMWNKWRIYPTLNALWGINDNHLLNLSFNSNSVFPNYWSTMSNVFYSSTYTEVHGNPDLKPYSYYNVNLMWQIKRRYTLMAFANLRPDYFVQLPYQTADRMAVIMKETNFDYSNSFGLQASAIFSAGKWLNGNVFAVGTYRHDKSSHFFDLPFDREKLSAIFGGTASVKLCETQDVRLILNPFFQSKAIQGVYDISPIFRMNAKLQWSSHDGKWGLRLNGSNIFNNFFDTRSVQGNQDYRMKINFNWSTVTFAVVYKFGGYKEKKVKEVDTSRMGH
ncbi:outer membrane protein, beta-barrel family [Prevotella sp. BV3P1]|uniref:outer membrane beta-barrel protein n=1 Tax=Prevotellaceae TaxID=171552 RepID=UPI0003B85658|nr:MULTISPECIES: outer membrane beta-barrel protein [Prevotellaceae]ERT62335.1 outer membrane protein, beta-barrel family [Prevotella sp. BV3P1]KGF39486.1 TonB-dependent receptor [Hoylesella buccalis DNF00985]